jgi:hypothetical protein
MLAFLEQRLRRTLPRGPWLVRDKSGTWLVAKDWHCLLQAMLPRIWDYGLAHQVAAERPPFPRVYRALLRLSVYVRSWQSRVWVAATTKKLRSGWTQVVHDAGASLLVTQTTSGSWRDYRQLFVNSLDTVVLTVPPLSMDDERVRRLEERLRQFGATMRNRDLAYAWSLYIPYLVKIFPAMLALSDEGARFLKRLNVRAVLAFEANSWLSAALCEAGSVAGVQRVVLNRNSQPPSGNAVADSILSTLFYHRTCNSLVDIAGIWSRSSLAWGESNSRIGGSTRAEPVCLDYPAATGQMVGARPFRILHAGNYQNWSDYFPWVSETSEEFLRGMEQLAAAAEKVSGIEVVFRVRPKREVDANALRGRIKTAGNVQVCDTDDDFLEQLADCDILVAHFSTTVEQALQMGKPVLLWGSTQRYAQFPGREVLPTPDSRAAVYVVRQAEALPAMLAAIHVAHAGRPLTAAECAPYRHQDGTPNITQWMRRVLGTSLSYQGQQA